MICKKDIEGCKVFWSAVTADRVIPPNGKKYEQLTYEPTGWYLFIADDEYWLYPVEGIERIECLPDSRLAVYPVEQPYAIYDKPKYKYELEDNTIKIAENSDAVSHPPHYASGWSNGAEVIDLTEHLSFCAGNVVKYVCRAGRKDPDKYVEDLEKARWYLDREIERVWGD
jgi:hypothetical protein